MQATIMTNQQKTSGKILGRLLMGAPQLEWINPDHEDRNRAESYIARKFHSDHGASIKDFMPHLLAIRCMGNLTAAIGLRHASDGPMFVEHYLDERSTALVTNLSGQADIDAGKIVELGNLVSTQRGSSQLLFVLLTALLYQADISWVIFTASRQVQTLLKKLNLDSITVCQADKKKLPDGGMSWGTYYDNNPCVTMIRIHDAYNQLSENRLSSALIKTFDSAIKQQATKFSGHRIKTGACSL